MSGAEPCTASKMDASWDHCENKVKRYSSMTTYTANVAGGRQAEATNETCAHIRQDITVQVGHHHDPVGIRLGVLDDL